MEEKVLHIESRTSNGSAESRRLRRTGKVPVSILYPDATSVAGIVIEKDFVHLAEMSKYTDVFHFKSDNQKLNGQKVLVKDLQKEPLKGSVLHVDFLALDDKKAINVKVPVALVGTPVGVKTQGGILTKSAQFLVVSCLPAVIPSEIEVDVTELKVGDRVIANELKFTNGLVLKSNERETIASVVASRATRLQETDAKAPEAAAKGAPAKAPAAAAKAPAKK